MQNQKKLTLFMVKSARYIVNDGEGEEITLLINYYDNYFRIMAGKRKVSKELRQKAKEVAQTLLGRKHRINYAYKFN